MSRLERIKDVEFICCTCFEIIDSLNRDETLKTIPCDYELANVNLTDCRICNNDECTVKTSLNAVIESNIRLPKETMKQVIGTLECRFHSILENIEKKKNLSAWF